MDLRTRVFVQTTIRSIMGTLSTAAIVVSVTAFSGCKDDSVSSTDQPIAANVFTTAASITGRPP